MAELPEIVSRSDVAQLVDRASASGHKVMVVVMAQEPSPSKPRGLLNGVQAAAYLGINRQRFYTWVKAGVIPVFVDPISGRKRYSVESLDKWLAGFTTAGDTTDA